MILFFASVEIILLAKKALEKGWKDVDVGMEGYWCRDGRMLVQGWKAGMGAQCHCRHSQHQVAPVLKIFFLLFLSNQQIILQQNARWFFFQKHGKRHRFTYTFVYVCIYFNCSAGHLMESGVLPCCPPPPAPSKRCAQCSTSLQLL